MQRVTGTARGRSGVDRTRVLGTFRSAVALTIVAVFAAAVAMEAAQGDLGELVEGFSLYGVVGLPAFGVLGAWLVFHDPHHRLAWIALSITAALAVSFAAEAYGLEGVERGWTGASWALWVAQWAWVPAYWLVPTVLLLLFPDGHLPGRRWRVAGVAAWAGLIVSTLGWALLPYEASDVALDVRAVNPVGWEGADAIMPIGVLLGFVSVVAALTSLGIRFKRSRGKERQQVKWVFMAAGTMIVLLAVAFSLGPDVAPFLVAAAMVPLPTAIAVAILRYGLWDVDVVINRTLVYGLLSVAVLAIYVGTVAVLGDAIGRRTGAPLIAVILIAVAIDPLRRGLQGLANRLLYGERDDPYAAMSRLTERLGALDPASSVISEVPATIARILRLSFVGVEVNGVVRSFGGQTKKLSIRKPLTYRGETVGTLIVEPHDGEDQLSASEERVLTELSRHIGVAIFAERLQQDLQASRERLVTAREEERRRLRRDLHDDLGPALAAAALQMERAGDLIAIDESAAKEVIESVAGRVRDTVKSVRSLVEDLGPPTLDELGLADAVREQMRRLANNGPRIDADIPRDLGRLPAAVEVAAYRIVSEALTNVIKHAAATRCRVEIRRDEDLQVVVEDDGRGISDEVGTGVGLESMRERAAELGGGVFIEESPLGGARIRARLPLGVE